MIIACTGHRPDKLGSEYDHDGYYSLAITNWFKAQIMGYQPEKGISGMALGADWLWAKACIEMDVWLIAAVPFIGQENKWPKKTQLEYRAILDTPGVSTKFICQPGYATWKLQKRNEWMVDNCDLLLAIWDGSSGGTKNCLDYAVSKGMTIENGKVIRFDPSKI